MDALEHPQCVAKSSSICAFWLLELVPYIVEVVPKLGKLGTEATTCSDAISPLTIKYSFLCDTTIAHRERTPFFYDGFIR
jgi:hypothetical protein